MSQDQISAVIVGANPGYNQIRFVAPSVGKITAQGIKEAARVFPIIAWKLSGDTRTPITPHDDAPADNEIRVLLLPSGVIIDAAGVQHRGLDPWCTAVAEEWRRSQPPARVGPGFSIGPIANPDPAPPSKSAWVA